MRASSGFVKGRTTQTDSASLIYDFVITDGTLQTAMAGVFAAGDVRAGSVKQAASAAGEGATAAVMIREYLRGQ